MLHQIEEEIISDISTNTNIGLTEEEVSHRKIRYGLNELKKQQRSFFIFFIIDQPGNFLAVILLGVTLLFTMITVNDKNEWFFGVMESILIFNILIAYTIGKACQEINANDKLEELKGTQIEYASVLREGKWKLILSKELVPGDIVQLSAGDKSPADIRLFKLLTPSLKIDESIITGEYKPINKYPTIASENSINQQINIVFSGTSILNGSANGVVINTGTKTVIGEILSLSINKKGIDDKTLMQEKLLIFLNLLTKMIFGVCILIWLISYKNLYDNVDRNIFKGVIYSFKFTISLAFAAIPEILPIIISVCLALGAQRMSKRNAILMKLSSIETLGCTTIICIDKTGTITTHELNVAKFFIPSTDQGDFDVFKIITHSYEPDGEIVGLKPDALKNNLNLIEFINCAYFCNNSVLKNAENRFNIAGRTTDDALRGLIEKIEKIKGIKREEFDNKDIKKIFTLEFTSERKYMSVLCERKNMQKILYIKGAPEKIIEYCTCIQLQHGVAPLSGLVKEIIQRRTEGYASKGLRCIAFAYKEDNGELNNCKESSSNPHKLLEDKKNSLEIERNLIFLGIVAMKNPLRSDIKNSIMLCKKSGIRVFMTTGDDQGTAEAIAKQAGIWDEQVISLSDQDLNELSDYQLTQKFLKGSSCIFNRIDSEKKYRIINTLNGIGEVVAITGDSVNDVSTIKAADIGIAMGISGVEIAKKASDLILTDNSLSAIIAAVEEGRSVYSNVKAVIRYLVSSNIGEIISVFLAVLLGIPEGFVPIQLLWIKLLTDGLPAIALGFNPHDQDTMNKSPRKRDEPFITTKDIFRYFIIGAYIGVSTVGIFVYWYLYFDGDDKHPLISYWQLFNWSQCSNWHNFKLKNWGGLNLKKHPCLYFTEGKLKPSTLSFSVLITIEMLNALNSLSENRSLIRRYPWTNPWLLLAIASSMIFHCIIMYHPFFNQVFGILPLTIKEWGLVFIFSMPIIFIEEFLKIFNKSSSIKIDKNKKYN